MAVTASVISVWPLSGCCSTFEMTGATLSTSAVLLAVLEMRPTLSMARALTVCLPWSAMESTPLYAVQLPPSREYSVRATPLCASPLSLMAAVTVLFVHCSVESVTPGTLGGAGSMYTFAVAVWPEALPAPSTTRAVTVVSPPAVMVTVGSPTGQPVHAPPLI